MEKSCDRRRGVTEQKKVAEAKVLKEEATGIRTGGVEE